MSNQNILWQGNRQQKYDLSEQADAPIHINTTGYGHNISGTEMEKVRKYSFL